MIEWPLGKRIAFRFGVLFGALTVLPYLFDPVPALGATPWLARPGAAARAAAPSTTPVPTAIRSLEASA